MQSTYNVKLRRVYETIFAVEKQRLTYFSVRVRVCVGVGGGVMALACVCARVILPKQHATRRHIANCVLCDSTKYFDIIS
jgi:hypothetical protein